MATITAMFLLYLLEFLKPFVRKAPVPGRLALVLLLVAVFVYPGMSIIKKVARTSEFFWDEEIYTMCYLLRDLQSFPELADKPFSIVFDGYNDHLLFYTQAIKYTLGQKIEVKPVETFYTGEYILASQESLINHIKSEYSRELIFQNHRIQLLKITGSSKSAHQQ